MPIIFSKYRIHEKELLVHANISKKGGIMIKAPQNMQMFSLIHDFRIIFQETGNFRSYRVIVIAGLL